jgi:hypothetical protein
MIRALSIVLALLLTTPSFAMSPPPWRPPARYDHPFKGKRIIKELPAWQLFSACSKLGSLVQYACTIIGGEIPGKQCTSYVLARGHYYLWTSKVDAAGFNELVRHETGHCNGWPANHPK